LRRALWLCAENEKNKGGRPRDGAHPHPPLLLPNFFIRARLTFILSPDKQADMEDDDEESKASPFFSINLIHAYYKKLHTYYAIRFFKIDAGEHFLMAFM